MVLNVKKVAQAVASTANLKFLTLSRRIKYLLVKYSDNALALKFVKEILKPH